MLYLMFLLYFLAGLNHFRSPQGYEAIIPPYLGNPHWINIAAGIAELLLSILLLIPKTRQLAAYGIVLMLIAFIPAHIYMITHGWRLANGYRVPDWASWVRLLILQPLLIWWAWTIARKSVG